MSDTYEISINDQMRADIIVDAIRRWEQYDRMADSHSGTTNKATELLRKAECCWIAVVELVANSNNATIYATSQKCSIVWSAVNQTRRRIS
jgi:predicted transcriptional regulator